MRFPSRTFLLSLVASFSLYGKSVLGQDQRDPTVQDDMSFGQKDHKQIWGEDHRSITGFDLSGDDGHHPDILSDRIVMTPPWPGNRRASMWADHPEQDAEWAVTMEFRDLGPPYASGNMQIWYVKDKKDIGTSSVYTVGKFDGLVVVLDNYGSSGGAIRGFLNDDTQSYKDHHHVDTLSFAHCEYPFRNTGLFASMEIKQTKDHLLVKIDDKECFKSSKVKLPRNYYFGLTAASAEQPDSFEVKSFIVHRLESTGGKYAHEHKGEPGFHEHNHPAQVKAASQEKPAGGKDVYGDKGWYWTEEKDRIKDADASSFRSDSERFDELHGRVLLLNHQMDMVFHDIMTLREFHEEKQKELLQWLAPIHDYVAQTKNMQERLELVIDQIKGDVELKEFKAQLEELRSLIGQSHISVMEHLPHALHSAAYAASPRLGFFVFIIVVSQVMLLGSYVIYRRRREMQPKKYL